MKEKLRTAHDKAGYTVENTSHGHAMVTDELIQRAQHQLGQIYKDKRQWKKAAMHFVQCKQTEHVAECLFRLGDYDKLTDLQTHCKDQCEVHKTLARSYQSVGMCTEACTSYIKVSCREDAVSEKHQQMWSCVTKCWGHRLSKGTLNICRLAWCRRP